MIGKTFTDEVISLAKKRKHKFCLMHHAAKVLLTKFNEPRRILNESELIDVNLFEELLDKKLKLIPNTCNEEPEYGSAFNAIVAGAAISAGSVMNVTELHLLTELVCLMVEEDGDMAEILSESCSDPLELKLFVSAILGGTTVKSLDSAHVSQVGDVTLVSKGVVGFKERAAKLDNKFIGCRADVEKLALAANKTGGSIVALVGEKKSGKTAILDAFNYWLLNTNDSVVKQGIVEIDLDVVLKTSINRGVFEHYLNEALHECKKNNSILYIDNIHYIVDACRDPIIMPLLARSADLGVTVICSITPDSYSKVFDKRGYNGVVSRINVTQQTKEIRNQILRNIANKLSNKAEVVYEDKAIVELIRLAELHLKPNVLGGAIEVLERCTTAHDGYIVTPKVVHGSVASVTGLELDILTSAKGEKLRTLSEKVKNSLFGQDEAIDKICEQIKVSWLGFKVKDKQPRCSFMMLGSSGVGKTETTEVVAKELGLESLVLNMGEYQEGHTISKLLGAPPGYMGWDAGDGVLAEFVSKHANGMIVFDEIEKANGRIFDLLLGMLDKGAMTTNTQKEIDFSGITIFFTSNCGADSSGNSFGLLKQNNGKDTIDHSVFERTFRPEFRNRLTAIINYKTLDKENIELITEKSISKVAERAATQYGIEIRYTEAVIQLISSRYYSQEMGARPIERGVDLEIGCRLGSNMLENPNSNKVFFDVVEDEVSMTIN